MLTSDMVELWSEDFIPSMTQEKYDAQPTKDKIFTFNDLDIEASPIQSYCILFHLHRFREAGHFSLEKVHHLNL